MDEARLQVNEELMDGMAARIDEPEQRLGAIIALLRRDSVCQAIGLQKCEFDRANKDELMLKLRPLKHTNERHRLLDERRQKELMTRLSRVSTARLEELLRDR